jgi:hypothetical protein
MTSSSIAIGENALSPFFTSPYNILGIRLNEADTQKQHVTLSRRLYEEVNVRSFACCACLDHLRGLRPGGRSHGSTH